MDTLLIFGTASGLSAEVLGAVRDYMVQECLGGLHGSKSSGGYEWTLKDGRVVKLLVSIENGGDSDAVD